MPNTERHTKSRVWPRNRAVLFGASLTFLVLGRLPG